MTLYKIKYCFKSIKEPNINNVIIENILLDDKTGEIFLQDLQKFIDKLEALSIDNNAKVKKLKYFIKSYKLKDISYDTKLIKIFAKRNIDDKKGYLKITTDHNIKLRNSHSINDEKIRNIYDFNSMASLLSEKLYSINKK
jgi:hypothetical protein